MKTTLAGASPIEQFIGKLKDSGIEIDSTRFQMFKIIFPKGGALLTQAYLLVDYGGYRLLLADARGWLLDPGSNGLRLDQLQMIDGEMKLLPEFEMNKSVEHVRQVVLGNRTNPMSEATIINNNGEVAVFSNGDGYPRGTLIPSIGYRNIISKDTFKEVFAVDSTVSEVKERLKTPQPSPDGTVSLPGRTRFPR